MDTSDKIIENSGGIRTPILCELTGLTQRTIERNINQLKKKNLIIFKGSYKTGGYFTIEFPDKSAVGE